MQAGWSRIAASALSILALIACGSPFESVSAGDAGADGAAEAAGDALVGEASDAGGIAHCNGGSVCTTSADCPVSSTACITSSCTAGCCSSSSARAATACTDNGGRVCDGAGRCVPCLMPSDCPAQATACKTNTCDATHACGVAFAATGTACADSAGIVCNGQGSCVSMHCMDGVKDANETDVDCGGATCAPCGNTKGCLVPTDCASGDCNAKICTACVHDTDCPVGAYCDLTVGGGTCTPTRSQGTTCTSSDQCATGFCANGVCCNAACTGTCQGCTVALTGSANGTCATLTPGSPAPSSQCPTSSTCGNDGRCAAGGVCEQAAAGTTCAPASCTGSLFTATSTCNGSGSCTPGASENCAAAGATCNAATGCVGTCNTNIALNATASDSGGGVTPYGPQDMNNGQPTNCSSFTWVMDSTTASGAWIQLTWPSPVSVASFYINTENGLTATPCPAPVTPGRNVASGTVQIWNGSAWSTVGSFSGQHGDVQFNLPVPTVTSMLRVFNLTTDPGNGNSIIFQWHVYSQTGCTPPP